MMWDAQLTQIFEENRQNQIQEMIIADHFLGGGGPIKGSPKHGKQGEVVYERVPRELKLIIALIVAYLLAVPTISAASQVKSISQTLGDLRKAWRINEDPSSPDDPRIRPAARALLKKLKHQLRDLILDTLNARGHRIGPPERLKSDLLAKLKRNGITAGSLGGRGTIADIGIHRPDKHPNLLAVTTTLEILCGTDTSLYLECRGISFFPDFSVANASLEMTDYMPVISSEARNLSFQMKRYPVGARFGIGGK